MLAKQLVRIASVVLLSISIPSFASDTELVLAKIREGIVSARKPQSYELILTAGDYAEIKFDPRGKELTLITYDPSGNKVRGAKLGPGGDKFDFIVDRDGKYRLEVAATDNAIGGSYAITLEKIVSLQARLAPLRPLYASPRINALKAAVETREPGKR